VRSGGLIFFRAAEESGRGCRSERRLFPLMGMTALLLGRAERSPPKAPEGHAVWRAGVDGERARRAIIVVAHDGASS
jgi:hypothetical protein